MGRAAAKTANVSVSCCMRPRLSAAPGVCRAVRCDKSGVREASSDRPYVSMVLMSWKRQWLRRSVTVSARRATGKSCNHRCTHIHTHTHATLLNTAPASDA